MGIAASAPSRVDPVVEATWCTGADVRQVVDYEVDGEPAVLVVAGSTLHALTWDGRTVFRHADRIVTRVLHVAQAGGPIALVLSREDRVDLLDLRTGASGWHYDGPEGTRLSGAGSSKLITHDGVLCWLLAPVYAEFVYCFEITSPTSVRTRWHHDFAGRYDRGFGPAMIVADVLQTGRPQLLLSSRTGSAYGDHGTDVPTEKVVLGRDDGKLYQALVDLGDGCVLQETAYRPDPGDYPCARPYGLLQSVGDGGQRLVVQVSCQVEEFYSVTRVGDRMSRAWGEFVEKDWPHDEQELRPQLSSVVERPGCEPLLVVGHFDATRWQTLVRSAGSGAVRSRLDRHYFWGTVRSTTGPLIIGSPAKQRQLTGAEGLAAFTVDGLEQVSSAAGLRPLTCATDVLPPELTFHADRQSIVTIAHDDAIGVLAVDGARLVWWDPAGGRVLTVGDLDASAAYPARDGAAIVVAGGMLYRVATDLSLAGPVQPQGRRPDVHAATAQGRAWTLTSYATGASELRFGEARSQFEGTGAELLPTDDGALVATIAAHRSVSVWRCYGGEAERLAEITPLGKPTHARFVGTDLVLVTELTGVHTAAAGMYDLSGRQLWRDAEHGPHPNLPLTGADRTGRWLVAYDDHGVLVLRDAYTGETLADRDWTAAYTTPLLVSADGRDLLVRTGGVHGMECLEMVADSNATITLDERWRLTAPLWRYFPGDAAVTRSAAGWRLAAPTPTGDMDIVDLADGRLVHSLRLGAVAARPPVVALPHGEVAAFLTGTADGRLLEIDAVDAAVREWPLAQHAAVESLAVASDDGDSVVLVGTADGVVRRLRL